MGNIVFKGIDGSVAIMTLAPGANEEDAIRKFHRAHPGQYEEKHYRDVEVPFSREFRDAWTLKGDKIVIGE